MDDRDVVGIGLTQTFHYTGFLDREIFIVGPIASCIKARLTMILRENG